MDTGSDPKILDSAAGVRPAPSALLSPPGFTLPRLPTAGVGDVDTRPPGRTTRISGAALFAETPLPAGTMAPQPAAEELRDDV